MIAEITQDLIDKLLTIPEFQGRVGSQVGGTDTDATMAEAPVPFAWVIFANSIPLTNEQSQGRSYLQVEHNYTVIVVIDYADGLTDTEFLTNKLSLLDKCVDAVHASPDINSVGKWQFTGIDLFKTYSNRLVYQLGFTSVGYKQIN